MVKDQESKRAEARIERSRRLRPTTVCPRIHPRRTRETIFRLLGQVKQVRPSVVFDFSSPAKPDSSPGVFLL